MTKAEQTMANLKADAAGKLPAPPRWDTRQRLALALMKADRQISCLNCTERYRPCRLYKECKADGTLVYFTPRKSLMEMQLKRVNYIIKAIKENELIKKQKKQDL